MTFICPIAIAQHWTDYKITAICHCSCGRNFELNLVKLCMVVLGWKTKMQFVGGQNPITPSSSILPPIFTNFHQSRYIFNETVQTLQY